MLINVKITLKYKFKFFKKNKLFFKWYDLIVMKGLYSIFLNIFKK